MYENLKKLMVEKYGSLKKTAETLYCSTGRLEDRLDGYMSWGAYDIMTIKNDLGYDLDERKD